MTAEWVKATGHTRQSAVPFPSLSAITAEWVKATAAGMAEVGRRVWQMMEICS